MFLIWWIYFWNFRKRRWDAHSISEQTKNQNGCPGLSTCLKQLLSISPASVIMLPYSCVELYLVYRGDGKTLKITQVNATHLAL